MEMAASDHVRWALLRVECFEYGGAVDKDVDLVHISGVKHLLFVLSSRIG